MRAHEFITELKFFGSPCTKDCSGHRAGYAWEKKKNRGARTNGNSNSFGNGTEIRANQVKQGLNPISGGITNARGQFQKFQPGLTTDVPPKNTPVV